MQVRSFLNTHLPTMVAIFSAHHHGATSATVPHISGRPTKDHNSMYHSSHGWSCVYSLSFGSLLISMMYYTTFLQNLQLEATCLLEIGSFWACHLIKGLWLLIAIYTILSKLEQFYPFFVDGKSASSAC